MEPEIYYREVNAYWGNECLAISCIKFRVISRTSKGAWISPLWDSEGEFKKFVLDGSGRRFAYPTRELARESFIIRKKREIQHCAAQHDRAIRYLALAKTGKFGTDTEALHEDGVVRIAGCLVPE